MSWTIVRLLAPVWGAVLVLVVASCGPADNASSYGEWTLEQDSLTLTEDLRVSGTDDYFFGSIRDVDVTASGHVVVVDADASHLKLLRPDGTLLDTLGRRGQGPGEFQGPTSVDVARGDSVYVFDNRVDRLTVYTPLPDAERARSTIITSDAGNLSDVRVLGDRLVGEFTPGYTRREGLYRPSPNTWHVLDETTAAGDSLLHVQRREVATSFSGQGAAIAYLPFGRVTLVVAGPDDRLYHGFTDSLRIRATSLDGSTETVAAVPADPIPVTDAERDSALSEVDTEIRHLIEDGFPDAKPAFTDLVVADDGRVWVRRPPATPDARTTSWWILHPSTKTIHEVRLPTNVDLEVVRAGKAYGMSAPKDSAPTLVTYRVD